MNEPTPDTSPAGLDARECEFIVDTLKAEADAITRIAERVGRSEHVHWAAALDLLEPCDGHVVLSGMGKSGLIGAKISATFSSLGQPSSTLHPAEAVHGDLGRLRRCDVVVLLSYSGNTEEVVNLAAILKTDDVPTIAITSDPTSKLAELTTVHLSTGDIVEACPLNLAPTASTAAMLSIGDALALALARRRDFDATDFHKHHPGGMLGVGLRPVTDVLRFRVGVNLPVVKPTLTVRDALLESRPSTGDRRTGAILVTDETGQLTGIFTDADLRRLLLSRPDAMDVRIGDVMTPSPRRLTTDSLVRDAVQLVTEHRLDEIPVINDHGTPVGLVDVQDLIALKIVRDE